MTVAAAVTLVGAALAACVALFVAGRARWFPEAREASRVLATFGPPRDHGFVVEYTNQVLIERAKWHREHGEAPRHTLSAFIQNGASVPIRDVVVGMFDPKFGSVHSRFDIFDVARVEFSFFPYLEAGKHAVLTEHTDSDWFPGPVFVDFTMNGTRWRIDPDGRVRRARSMPGLISLKRWGIGLIYAERRMTTAAEWAYPFSRPAVLRLIRKNPSFNAKPEWHPEAWVPISESFNFFGGHRWATHAPLMLRQRLRETARRTTTGGMAALRSLRARR